MAKTSESKKCLPPKIRPFLKTISSSKETFEGLAAIKEEIVEETDEIVPKQAQRNDQGDHTYFARISCKVCHSTFSARSTFLAHYVVHLQQVNKKPLKSVHFKKPVTRSLFLSKSVVIFNITITNPCSGFTRLFSCTFTI